LRGIRGFHNVRQPMRAGSVPGCGYVWLDRDSKGTGGGVLIIGCTAARFSVDRLANCPWPHEGIHSRLPARKSNGGRVPDGFQPRMALALE